MIARRGAILWVGRGLLRGPEGRQGPDKDELGVISTVMPGAATIAPCRTAQTTLSAAF